ncbi:N-formylglutamate amidohydrolase [Sphingorhabdus sp.]|uniref:N-formylglutamate amidohydrolase n=1 Tax=Sphingorhabdus sp. TaxID=1902408 RepID=UPI00391CCCF6
MSPRPFDILGAPQKGGFLIIGDHASNRIPDDIHLGIDPELLGAHIAWDIGVAPVARLITQDDRFTAFLGGYSRLVVDLNRDEGDEAAIPRESDGFLIPGNDLAPAGRELRLARFHRPYHDRLQQMLAECRPALILSLHSFTPALESRPNEARPWEVGVLYNEQEAASKLAIPFLEDAGFNVGDQLPYSGKILNASMNRHAEANAIPYIGIEMRQDLAGSKSGQARFARILSKMCHFVSEHLG